MREKGFQIIRENYRLRGGEIDIIARDGGYIVFIEVKFRTGMNFGRPAEAVGHAKQQKIIHTAMHYIVAENFEGPDFRFDIVEVLEQNGKMYANHIENAFGA